MAWLPGEEGAGAIADVLSGDTNPGGKLPISYPRAVGQVPVFYAHKASGGRSHPVGDYVDQSASAALPVRSRAQLHDVRAVRVADRRARRCGGADEIVVEARRDQHRRAGRRRGRAALHRAIRRRAVTRPVLELKSFLRLTLEPGESRRITFRVPVGQLGFYDRDLSVRRRAGRDRGVPRSSSADLVEVGFATVRRPVGCSPRRRSTDPVRREDGAPRQQLPSGSVGGWRDGRRRSGRARDEGLRRRREGSRRRQSRDRRRRVHGARRPVGLREDNAPADDRGARAGRRAGGSSSAAKT